MNSNLKLGCRVYGKRIIKHFELRPSEMYRQLMNEPQLLAHLCQIDTWLRE